MDSIDLMIKEHKYIKRMIFVVRKASMNIINGEEINFDDFKKIIEFIRNFADGHHHGKEENMLFNKMSEEIGGAAEKLVRHGMLVEHDMGRLFIKELEEALEKVKNGDNNSKIDVIANAVSYGNLLNRHIDKEDTVVYTFARRELKSETISKIDKECESYEEKNKEVPKEYIRLLEDLEKKYL